MSFLMCADATVTVLLLTKVGVLQNGFPHSFLPTHTHTHTHTHTEREREREREKEGEREPECQPPFLLLEFSNSLVCLATAQGM
jgi:hypothetical protein